MTKEELIDFIQRGVPDGAEIKIWRDGDFGGYTGEIRLYPPSYFHEYWMLEASDLQDEE